MSSSQHHWMNRIVEAFLQGNLSVVLIIVSFVAGIVALTFTPREEDPQIVVPIADVFVNMPGASAAEVERQVSTRLEKLLYQIDGVEYVYSMSFPSRAIVTVRFYVGEDRERSWVKLYNKIYSNVDQIPPGVTGWVVKPVEIDDVPIVNLSLYSDKYGDYELRRLAEELEIRLQGVRNAGRTYIVGGSPRSIIISIDPHKMAAHGICLQDIKRVISAANGVMPSGELILGNRTAYIEAGRFLMSSQDVENLVVGIHDGRPVYLRNIAEVRDGPDEPKTYTRIAFGSKAFTRLDPATEKDDEKPPEGIKLFTDYPAVTVAVAKHKGTNAVTVAEEIIREAKRFANEVFPEGVYLRVTRNYGKTANEKVNELIEALVVAIVIVILLLAYTIGWREGLIIAFAVPITFSLTLLINMFLGYTINRVTLFALILSLGLVVDDPIVDVENIHRHFVLRKEPPFRAVITAVSEVRPPIIWATLAVILSFLPMFFITGMMGPYMAPMAVNVPVSMFMSLVVSFTITPWMALHVLKRVYDRPHHEKPFVLEETLLFRIYSRIMEPVIEKPRIRLAIVGILLGLFAFCGWLIFSKRVPLKMLPFDNKNELQIVIDMPEGSTLERTEAVVYELSGYLLRQQEVTDVSWYVGTASPMDFNGLVRHYYLREGSNVADIRVNLVEKKKRAQQSHAIGLRIRKDLTEIAHRWGANIKIVEIPPGPPVIATIVAEVYGKSPLQPYTELVDAAKRVRQIMESIPGIVDVDDTIVAPQEKISWIIDRVKAGILGINNSQVAEVISDMVYGGVFGSLRLPDQVHPVEIRARLPRLHRAIPEELGALMVKNSSGQMVYLSEIGYFERQTIDQPIYHKNLRPLVYVFADTAGLPPPEAIFTLKEAVSKDPSLKNFDIVWSGEGEWDITVRVFRDLGIAFGVAVLGVYILLLYQTRSYILPIIQLIALPLSIIGIIPGFWILNLLFGETVGGWQNHVYFTATAMIGMIALAGIATRNSILLIEFIEERRKEGKPLVRSLIEAGAVRMRAIFLTSFSAMLAAWPITLDPIFSGLAWSLILGISVSTFFTLIVVPMVYFMVYRDRR
ncbi:MAG: efflux RND transporter permease subunit [Syntrophobacterales bacterium]|nr:efflux RND transporter permease subunit [Syntrophobacterales bacterium]